MPHHNSIIQKRISWIGFPIGFAEFTPYFDGTNYFQSHIEVTDDNEYILIPAVLKKRNLINPFTLRAAKRGLTILEIFSLQKHFFENIWRRNVNQRLHNNSPSNILRTFALFPSYFQKYERSRRYFLEKLWVWMG